MKLSCIQGHNQKGQGAWYSPIRRSASFRPPSPWNNTLMTLCTNWALVGTFQKLEPPLESTQPPSLVVPLSASWNYRFIFFFKLCVLYFCITEFPPGRWPFGLYIDHMTKQQIIRLKIQNFTNSNSHMTMWQNRNISMKINNVTKMKRTTWGKIKKFLLKIKMIILKIRDLTKNKKM